MNARFSPSHKRANLPQPYVVVNRLILVVQFQAKSELYEDVLDALRGATLKVNITNTITNTIANTITTTTTLLRMVVQSLPYEYWLSPLARSLSLSLLVGAHAHLCM